MSHSIGTKPLLTKQSIKSEHPLQVISPVVLHESKIISKQMEDEDSLSPTAFLLLLHYTLSHLPFDQLRLMATIRHLPHKLLKARIPKCADCSYGKSIRRAWRSNGPVNKQGGQFSTMPGQFVSVDQLQSPIPGLIAQLKGIPTTQRYNAATIFVEHCNRSSYFHLQRSLSSGDTVRAKRVFERMCESHGVNVLHYHADNGRFADTMFLRDIEEKNQTIIYCGVNAHFQNGILEKEIHDLQDLTHTSLLRAMSRWPKVVANCLWPCTL